MSGSVYIHIGHVAKPHGLGGSVKVVGPWGFEGVFSKDQILYLVPASDQAPPVRPPARLTDTELEALEGGRRSALRTISRMGKFLILSLEGIEDRDTAEALRGMEVYGPAGSLENRPTDQYYPQDLIGMEVYTPAQRHLGRIEDVMNTGANDIYVVIHPNGVEYMLPGVSEFRKEVDLAGRRMVFDPPEGLLELYESEA